MEEKVARPADGLEITLVRHGKSAHRKRGVLTAGEFGEWMRAYDRSGILRDGPVPEALHRKARSVGLVVTSDLARAVESAELLAPGGEIVTTPLLREVAPADGPRLPVRLGPHLWTAVSRAFWLLGWASGREPLCDACTRARSAAALLDRLARRHGSILVVGHGLINQFIARDLRRRGWRGPWTPGVRHWATASYRKAAA